VSAGFVDSVLSALDSDPQLALDIAQLVVIRFFAPGQRQQILQRVGIPTAL